MSRKFAESPEKLLHALSAMEKGIVPFSIKIDYLSRKII